MALVRRCSPFSLKMAQQCHCACSEIKISGSGQALQASSIFLLCFSLASLLSPVYFILLRFVYSVIFFCLILVMPFVLLYSHFSLVRTISGKEKILYYRELLVSEKFFKTRWIPLVLPSPVILGEKFFYYMYRELLVSEKFFV